MPEAGRICGVQLHCRNARRLYQAYRKEGSSYPVDERLRIRRIGHCLVLEPLTPLSNG